MSTSSTQTSTSSTQTANPKTIENLKLKDTKPKQRRPERIAQWLFETCGSWRNILAFALVASLTYISIRFNYELGLISGSDPKSKQLLPYGYALLDLSALFLSGYVGIKSRSYFRKGIAWIWFAFLLGLSLWAAAAFTMSVDYNLTLPALDAQIAQKKRELDTQHTSVETWQENVANAVAFKTKHQSTLSVEQAKERKLAAELAMLESSRIPPAQIIYERAAPYFELDPSALQLIVRLLWAGALTLSPLVLMLLIGAELATTSSNKEPEENAPAPGPGKRTRINELSDSIASALERTLAKTHLRPIRQNAPASASANDDQNGEELQSIEPPKKRTVPEQVHPSRKNAPERVHPNPENAPAKQTEKRTPKQKTHPRDPSDQRDAGVEGDAAHRYEAAKRLIIQGKLKPSLRKIREHCQCNQDVATRYQQALVEEGIIEQRASGHYQLRKPHLTKTAAGV